MLTFREFGQQIIAERAKYIRGPAKERNRWAVHVATAAFADMPLGEIRRRHIGEWHTTMIGKRAQDRRKPRTLAKPTIERCHALVSVIFGEALRRELIESNPCVGQKLRMPKGDADTEEKWAYLSLEEQAAIKACEAIPEWDRWGMQFAWGTGLRQGEQCNLELRDVHLDGPEPHVYVRYGSPGKPPKSGKPRRVPLFGDGLEAARELVKIAGTKPNPCGLLFPSSTGGRRSVGKPLGRSKRSHDRWRDPFHLHLKAAGVDRHFRWHDLRHTCASSLVIGCWGRAWRLEEIQVLMGHSAITITQRYAHLGEDALKRAARETVSPQVQTQAIAKQGFVSKLFGRLTRNAA